MVEGDDEIKTLGEAEDNFDIERVKNKSSSLIYCSVDDLSNFCETLDDADLVRVRFDMDTATIHSPKHTINEL